MIVPRVGHIVRVHESDNVSELGRIVWVEQAEMPEDFVYLAYPDIQKLPNGRERRRNHIKAEQHGSIAKLNESINAQRISLVPEAPRGEQLLTDEELSGSDPQVGLLRKTRRNLSAWKKRREADLALIAPILKRYSPDQLFGEGLLQRAIQQRAKALAKSKALDVSRVKTKDGKKAKNAAKRHTAADYSHSRSLALRIEQTLRRYFLYGATPNALLPRYFNSGGIGQVKFCKVRTGRPERSPKGRLPRTAATVSKLRIGYRRHKRKGMSDEDAYVATLSDMWAQSVCYLGPKEAEVTLLPEAQRPSLAEFVRVGRSEGMERSPEKFAMGAVAFAGKYRDRRGTAKDGIHAVGQVGILDSTSEDHTPVSMASRLLWLPVPWRTMIVDGFTEYIFGVYRGFEHGGTSAGLSALYHSERDKLEWADQEEIHLSKDEWLSMAFLNVKGDHGDLKSERGIATLTRSEMSLEIVRAYTPQWKSVEPVHQQMHVASDHRLPGTNYGELRSRGQRAEEAFLNFREGWPPLVRQISFYNNEEPVPHLLTLAMQRAKVKATRRDIVLYCMAEGLVSSQPTNLDALRAACLPILAAQGHADRIEVWDPRVPKGKRKVPRMLYFGEFMNTPAWKLHPVKDIDIRMNTSRVGEAFVNFAGLQTLRLLHRDHERHSLTLADWLFISDNDGLAKFLDQGRLEEKKASIHASNQLGFAAAKAEKDAQATAAGGAHSSRSRSSASKRKALASEATFLRQYAMGLAPVSAAGAPASPAPGTWKRAESLPELVEEDDTDMNRLREQRR